MWTQAVRRVLVFVICLCAEPHLSSARRGLHFLAPSAWAEVSSGLMPVLARLPLDYRFHVATLQVDGVTLDSTPVVVRRRWWEGKGVDLIASVDVSQMTPGLHRLAAIIEPTESGMTRLDTPKSKETVRAEAWFVLRPRPHRLSLYVVDEVGEPRYGKVQIMGDGEQFTIGNPHDGLSDPSQRDVPRTSLLVTPDGGTEFLASGRYRVLASAGIRDGIDHREIQVDGDASLTLTVPRLISTPDETTADLHVHTALSSDAFISDTQRFHALAAADVEAAVISDHNKMRDPVPALEMLGMSEDLEAITGVEFRIGPAGESIGHGNAFPLKPGVAALKPKNRSPGEVFDAWRVHHQANPVEGDSTPVLIQLNHPRGIQFRSDRKHRTDAHALFEELDFNPKLPLRHQKDKRVRKYWKSKEKKFLSFDAMEVLNRFSVPGWLQVRRDWFSLLNRGYRITATGNSDSHTAQLEPVGFPVNLVRRSDSTVSSLVEGVREGRVRVSTGPLVSIWAETPDWRATSSRTLHSVSGPVTVTIHVQAVDWVDVQEVRLVMNGVVIFRGMVGDSPVDRSWSFELDPSADAWVTAEAGHPLKDGDRPEDGHYATIAPGHVPIGFTNPIWLDRDDDGRFSFTAAPAGQGPR